MLAAAALAVAAGVTVLVTTGGSSPPRRAPASPAFASPATLAAASVGGGATLSRVLPRVPWLVSFDLRFVPGSRVVINPGSAHDRLIITGSTTPSASWRGRSYLLRTRPGWGTGAWRHVELRGGGRGARIAIDGQSLPAGRLIGRRFGVAAPSGRAALAAVLISPTTDRASLPLHRLAELHARLPAPSPVLGADPQDGLHLSASTADGYWPGALWQAAILDPSGGMFAGWARQATLAGLAAPGPSRAPGASAVTSAVTSAGTSAATSAAALVAVQSTLAAWRALCRGRAQPDAACGRLTDSALAAADGLAALAATNPGAGTIPTGAATPVAATDIDSMMILPLLTWASRITGRSDYARLALHHAHVVAALLVRSDGSTAEVVRFDRSTGRIRFLGGRQAVAPGGTWARGEGEALYGFAQTAADLRNQGLLGIAQRIAGYVAKNLPASGIPPVDYGAPAGAAPDVSAAAITAAGMFRLATACSLMSSVCSDPGQYTALGSQILTAILAGERANPPIGYLGGQVLDERAAGCWCDGGELMMGLSYTLEALGLERRAAA